MSQRIDVLVVDDSPLFAEAITKILQHDRAINIVGVATHGAQAVDMVERLKPHIITMDVHMPVMAPTKELLTGYKNNSISWNQYETQFNEIITQRQIEKHIDSQDLHMTCLLCAESKPDNCHRRLLAEHLAKHLQNISIIHL